MQEQTEAEIVVRARVHDVMAVIADLAEYPEWCPGVESVDVLTRDNAGRPLTADMVLDSGPVQDTLRYRYDWSQNDAVSWSLVDGKILQSLDGRYRCTRLGHDSTLVTYRLTIDLAMPMISALKRRAEKHLVSTAVKGLKRRVEELAARPGQPT